MPKLYEYLGISVYFYANDHLPVHVHGRYGKLETKAVLLVCEGQVVGIEFETVKGRRPLPPAKLQHFKKLVEAKGEDILAKWFEVFVKNMEITTEVITRRI